jgi:hypothetical protein
MPVLATPEGLSRCLVTFALSLEGQMDNETSKQSFKFNPDAPVELENGPDATGYWFTAVVICAVLAAGIIIYRAANSDTVIARNDIAPPAAQSDPIAPPPLVR